MKNTKYMKNNLGIGLIEVLVTTVVIALGLLSVASFQGNLFSGSRENKTRAECQVIANTKIQQLRDTVEKTGVSGYDSLTSSVAAESLTGVNETYSLSWVVTNQVNPERKGVSVTTSWGAGGVDNQCVLQTVIAFDNIGNSSLAATTSGAGGIGASPSTNAESSDDISEYIDITPGVTSEGDMNTIGGKTFIAQREETLDDGTVVQKGVIINLCSSYSPALTDFEIFDDSAGDFSGATKVRRVDYDGLVGKEAIELYEVPAKYPTYCTPRVRYNGGVIVPIRGTVYSKINTAKGKKPILLLSVDLFTFNVSESGTFCMFTPIFGDTEAEYTCYVGGNCSNGPAGTLQSDGTPAASGDETIVTQCPNPIIKTEKVGPGGWRGKVGLLGIAAEGYNVCQKEEVDGVPAELDTARNYYSRRGSGASATNEGINQPYDCHDFLIIEVPSATAIKVHDECLIQGAGHTLASKNIERSVSGYNVHVPTPNIASCP
jgi:hypothetical protein